MFPIQIFRIVVEWPASKVMNPVRAFLKCRSAPWAALGSPFRMIFPYGRSALASGEEPERGNAQQIINCSVRRLTFDRLIVHIEVLGLLWQGRAALHMGFRKQLQFRLW